MVCPQGPHRTSLPSSQGRALLGPITLLRPPLRTVLAGLATWHHETNKSSTPSLGGPIRPPSPAMQRLSSCGRGFGLSVRGGSLPRKQSSTLISECLLTPQKGRNVVLLCSFRAMANFGLFFPFSSFSHLQLLHIPVTIDAHLTTDIQPSINPHHAVEGGAHPCSHASDNLITVQITCWRRRELPVTRRPRATVDVPKRYDRACRMGPRGIWWRFLRLWCR